MMMERFFVILLSLGLFFALSLVACIPMLLLSLLSESESTSSKMIQPNMNSGTRTLKLA